jgi:pyruvate dehydrogenase E1 component alpha subunit
VLEAGLVSEEELKAIDADVRTIINAAAEFAQNDVEPAAGELWTDVVVPA